MKPQVYFEEICSFSLYKLETFVVICILYKFLILSTLFHILIIKCGGGGEIEWPEGF